MRNQALLLGLLTLLLHILSANTCQSNCCQSSSCCIQCASQCQTTNCCSQCANHCQTDCNNPKPTVLPPSPSPPSPSPPWIPPGWSSYSDQIENTNEHDNNITSTINLNNTINNMNHIYIPINITNNNVQSIRIEEASSSVIWPTPSTVPTVPTAPTVPTIPTAPTPPTVPTHPTPVTPCPTVPIPVPMPIPVPDGKPEQCCFMIIPCIYENCNPYRRVCGDMCTGSYIYNPINPCGGGCYKRNYYSRYSCRSEGCRSIRTDCSECREDFYSTYSNYRQCGGCFYNR